METELVVSQLLNDGPMLQSANRDAAVVPEINRVLSLPPEDLFADPEAERIVARLLRRPTDPAAKPVRVAAFQSFI